MENREGVRMEKELYVAAMKGDVGFLRDDSRRDDEYYLRRTSEGNNIIHVAIRHELLEFIEAVVLEKFPTNYAVISDGNSIKNTPLHIAAEVGNFNVVSLLYDHLLLSKRIVGEGGDDHKPWRASNSKGDTPVHVAIIHDNVKIAKFLLDKDPSLARILNPNSMEAPLHLAIKQHINFSESESIMAKIRQPIDEGGAELVVQSAPEENMSHMIEFLVKKDSSVTSWPDKDGVTPLHRAASLSTPYNREITKLIIEHWPQSAEVCDGSGRSILHLLLSKKIPSYQEGKALLDVTELYALRNHQDKDGNTPLHVAVENKDTIMIRVLLESSTKTNINNNKGVCATSAIQQQKVFQILRQRYLTKEEIEAAGMANIVYLRERWAMFEKDFLLSQDSKGKNILHHLMLIIKNEVRIRRDEFLRFIRDVLTDLPALVCQTDKSRNTPVHILAQNTDTKIYINSPNRNAQQSNNENDSNVNDNDQLKSLWHSEVLTDLLEECNKCITKLENAPRNTGAHFATPWLVQNALGNTPLHEAVIANNKVLVLKLLEYNEQSAGFVNNRMETPLHLVAKSPANMEPFDRRDIDKMVKANEKAAELPDEEGLTPILRAFKARNLFTATTLCRVCPKAAKIGNTDGQTFWHLLMKHTSGNYLVYGLLQEEALRGHLSSQDKNGDTPLHLAITLSRWEIIQDFLDTWKLTRKTERVKERERGLSKHTCWWLLNLLRIPNKGRDPELLNGKHQWLVDLFKIENKDGKTPSDLIAGSTCLPPSIEKTIKDSYELVGVRSFWGISTTKTETYMSTMGIIAALLATITFTAAFTVPGGLFEDIGTPIMIKKASFQVFMIFDVIAMCLSTIVLIFLLKIMATTDRRNSVVILDLCIALTLMSFGATLVTFMTGLFAAMFSVKRWIAIVTIVLCSLITALVLRFLFNKLVVPFKQTILYFSWMSGRKSIQSSKAKPRTEANNQGHPQRPPV